jgi:hypothetical protein
MKENKKLKEAIINSIQNLDLDNLNIKNIIDYIDYVDKVRYTESEVINVLLEIIKQKIEKIQ